MNTVSKHGVHIMQKTLIDMLEKIQHQATELVPHLSNLLYNQILTLIPFIAEGNVVILLRS